jgi:type I restriction-modification system DNA methylase subunit
LLNEFLHPPSQKTLHKILKIFVLTKAQDVVYSPADHTTGRLFFLPRIMSKYDALDARTELEQVIFDDLRLALEKRGWKVVHNGTKGGHAPANVPDIVASNKNAVITFEATKSKGAAQDRELLSISHHLKLLKEKSGSKKCYCVFISPETGPRMLNGIHDHNHQRVSDGVADLKIVPLSFDNFELWVTRLRDSEKDLYPVNDFLKIFQHHTEFIDDLRILKLLHQYVFPEDSALGEQIEREETERDQKAYESFLRDLTRMENFMRENGVATGSTAIDNLIYLVFLKLYGEKRERDGHVDPLRSETDFENYRNFVSAPVRNSNRAIHQLFETVKEETEFVSSGMFTKGSHLEDSVEDGFITGYVIPTFSKYKFLGTRIDALGALYETLALRAAKDIKVGQFFTPENVVHFMVKLAELDFTDMVLDPACGTGRFLINAMRDMLEKLEKSSVKNKASERNQICLHRLFGADIDQRIAKIAKMNMWIHGDGKSNIFGGRDYNGLILHKHGFDGHESFDNAFDVVLTNPPLGELNYQVIPFTDNEDDKSPEAELRTLLEKFRRMPILPRKNVTEEQLKAVRTRLETYRRELAELEARKAAAEKEDAADTPKGKDYQRFSASVQSKRRTIEQNELLEADLDARLRSGREDQIEWEITGNTMKGGAMFLAAIWHYLKDVAYPDLPPEWRGGKALVILDEGILNTDNYKAVRDFIRSHYYIKAVISLTRDTFVPVSKTTTKTSILYLVKKTDLNAVQQEPIFYGHVERVGLDTKKRVGPNDLDSILERYFSFKEKVLSSYAGSVFRRDRFLARGAEEGDL